MDTLYLPKKYPEPLLLSLHLPKKTPCTTLTPPDSGSCVNSAVYMHV